MVELVGANLFNAFMVTGLELEYLCTCIFHLLLLFFVFSFLLRSLGIFFLHSLPIEISFKFYQYSCDIYDLHGLEGMKQYLI